MLPSPVDHKAHTDQVEFLPASPTLIDSQYLSGTITLPMLFAFSVSDKNKYAWHIIITSMQYVYIIEF